LTPEPQETSAIVIEVLAALRLNSRLLKVADIKSRQQLLKVFESRVNGGSC
jgi:hypothetical protein